MFGLTIQWNQAALALSPTFHRPRINENPKLDSDASFDREYGVSLMTTMKTKRTEHIFANEILQTCYL